MGPPMDPRADLLARLNRLVERRRMPRLKRFFLHPLSAIRNSAVMRSSNALARRKWLLQKDVDLFFGGRMSIVIPSGYGELYCYGATVDSDAEVRFNEFLVRELREGQVFFDGGACLGYYSLLASVLVGPTGSVRAFEPSISLISLLRMNVHDRPNVEVVEKALSADAGRAEFFIAPLPWIGTSSLLNGWIPQKTKKISVETVRLDDYCQSTGLFPNIIKLDVEGNEERVLLGGQKLFRDKSPYIVMELFTPLKDQDRAALRLLAEMGYRPHAILRGGELKALEYGENLEGYLAELKSRYRKIQDSINDWDNLVFKR